MKGTRNDRRHKEEAIKVPSEVHDAFLALHMDAHVAMERLAKLCGMMGFESLHAEYTAIAKDINERANFLIRHPKHEKLPALINDEP